jgi:hypothetical protein
MGCSSSGWTSRQASTAQSARPVGSRSGYIALLRSTSTRDIMENLIVGGPATITVGPGVKAVEVSRCQPWSRLGDSLDEVIAAAAKHMNTPSHDQLDQLPRDQVGALARDLTA